MFSCDSKEGNHLCIDNIENIQSQENEIKRLFHKEGELKEELENAQLYIKTLEYETQELIKKIKSQK